MREHWRKYLEPIFASKKKSMLVKFGSASKEAAKNKAER
jgi:hypothetical protein